VLCPTLCAKVKKIAAARWENEEATFGEQTSGCIERFIWDIFSSLASRSREGFRVCVRDGDLPVGGECPFGNIRGFPLDLDHWIYPAMAGLVLRSRFELHSISNQILRNLGLQLANSQSSLSFAKSPLLD
jgi:hypothetical protein